jgi:hypothetical protein
MGRLFQPPPHVVVALVRSGGAGRTARRAIAALFVDVVPADWHVDARLVVSELVANALTECGECQLSMWFEVDANSLRVEVSDLSANLPVPQPHDSTRVGGHGLRIVEALSTRWGVDVHAIGKSVWFEIDG